jgi:hypothetical protein
LPLAGNFHGLGEHPLVHITDRNNLNRRNLDQPPQVALPIPPRPDQPHPLWLPRCNLQRLGTHRRERKRRRTNPKKTAAANLKWRCMRSFHKMHCVYVTHFFPLSLCPAT